MMSSAGKIILSHNYVTTIAGNSRENPYGYNNSNKGINIVLDVHSIRRTDGYIILFIIQGQDKHLMVTFGMPKCPMVALLLFLLVLHF